METFFTRAGARCPGLSLAPWLKTDSKVPPGRACSCAPREGRDGLQVSMRRNPAWQVASVCRTKRPALIRRTVLRPLIRGQDCVFLQQPPHAGWIGTNLQPVV